MTGATDRDGGRRAIATLAILVLVNTVNYMDRNVINILLPRIKEHLLLGDTTLGLVGGVSFTVFYALAALPIGRAVDTMPRRIVLTAGLIVWSAATFASGAAGSLAALLAARAFTGAGEATAHPAGISLIGDLFDARRRTIAIAVFQGGIALGGGIGVILGGHIASVWDWRTTLMVFAFMGAALAPLITLLPEPARGAAEGRGGQSVPARPLWQTVRRLLEVRTLVLHYASTAFVMFALQGFVVWMPSFLERRRGFDPEQVSNLAGAATLVGGLAGGVLGGWLADWLWTKDRRGRLALQTVAALLAIPCMLATVLVPSTPVIVAGLFASMILLVVMFPIISAVIVDLVGPTDRGTAMALLLLMQTGVGFSLGPLAVGSISDASGDLAIGLLAAPAALVVVVVLGAFSMSSILRDLDRHA